MARIVVELTNRCNLKCQHCFTGRHGGNDDLPLNILRRILDEAKSWGKIKKTAERAMAWVEPTVALPLLVTGALQDQLTRDRSRIDLTWKGEILEKLSHKQPS